MSQHNLDPMTTAATKATLLVTGIERKADEANMMITGSLLSTTGTEQFPLTHTASITSLGSPSLGNVDDVNDIEAIEIQRIPQLGRSKSYEKQLEVESINKFYDNTATDGCQRRKNLHRIPMQEKAVHAHQVDATVSHDGLQVVLFECSPPDAKDADKAFSDHFKLTRDLKDTWIYNVEAMIQNGREPTRGLTVYGVHIARNRLELYALDFMGCFRLHECTTITLPTRLSTFQTCFQELVQKSFWFAKQVKAELDKWTLHKL
ncbi:hypothetical protein BX616_004771 [Lobosporangium transversale]|uniref:Uncharacterized protein n=1 Tax=Lobosporangium transversale TaxID=64571 RepID=A0A1Y2GG58_9FUNG|nr:hypothetical protein BCR41DRAFT_423930 [Lobosporangium transversale]KAF9897917.1 hypothetical protein BX616_004771 [Lobosporangium transversale]ORZ09976.1 hypothetical protein BCR41DRAFT_423930 [Lobosporangium transversale]|eukprot:XP_021879066.1 hypothetical protein BCR41DRAFT_423930 [Lobosporangium transversale]